MGLTTLVASISRREKNYKLTPLERTGLIEAGYTVLSDNQACLVNLKLK